MVEGYHAFLDGGDTPVPVLWGMHGLVLAILTVFPSPTPFTRSPSSDTALLGTDNHGQPHEDCPMLLLLPVCPMFWDLDEGPTEPPFIFHLDSLLNTRIPPHLAHNPVPVTSPLPLHPHSEHW